MEMDDEWTIKPEETAESMNVDSEEDVDTDDESEYENISCSRKKSEKKVESLPNCSNCGAKPTCKRLHPKKKSVVLCSNCYNWLSGRGYNRPVHLEKRRAERIEYNESFGDESGNTTEKDGSESDEGEPGVIRCKNCKTTSPGKNVKSHWRPVPNSPNGKWCEACRLYSIRKKRVRPPYLFGGNTTTTLPHNGGCRAPSQVIVRASASRPIKSKMAAIVVPKKTSNSERHRGGSNSSTSPIVFRDPRVFVEVKSETGVISPVISSSPPAYVAPVPSTPTARIPQISIPPSPSPSTTSRNTSGLEQNLPSNHASLPYTSVRELAATLQSDVDFIGSLIIHDATADDVFTIGARERLSQLQANKNSLKPFLAREEKSQSSNLSAALKKEFVGLGVKACMAAGDWRLEQGSS